MRRIKLDVNPLTLLRGFLIPLKGEHRRRCYRRDNDIFQGKSPFKAFRMEAVDHWPENVIDQCEQADGVLQKASLLLH